MKSHSCPVWLCIWQRNQENAFQGGEDERVSVRGCTNFKVSVTAAVVRISRKNRSLRIGWFANEFPFVETSFTLSEYVSEERSGNTQVRKFLRCRCIWMVAFALVGWGSPLAPSWLGGVPLPLLGWVLPAPSPLPFFLVVEVCPFPCPPLSLVGWSPTPFLVRLFFFLVGWSSHSLPGLAVSPPLLVGRTPPLLSPSFFGAHHSLCWFGFPTPFVGWDVSLRLVCFERKEKEK